MPVERQNENEPPNGGWGWMVVFGAALINVSNFFLNTYNVAYINGDIMTAMCLHQRFSNLFSSIISSNFDN